MIGRSFMMASRTLTHLLIQKKKNTYTFRKDGHKIVLTPLNPTMAPASKPAEHNSLLSKSELEKEISAGSYVMALVAIEETESEKEIQKN